MIFFQILKNYPTHLEVAMGMSGGHPSIGQGPGDATGFVRSTIGLVCAGAKLHVKRHATEALYRRPIGTDLPPFTWKRV
jgi:hypothetical protein